MASAVFLGFQLFLFELTDSGRVNYNSLITVISSRMFRNSSNSWSFKVWNFVELRTVRHYKQMRWFVTQNDIDNQNWNILYKICKRSWSLRLAVKNYIRGRHKFDFISTANAKEFSATGQYPPLIDFQRLGALQSVSMYIRHVYVHKKLQFFLWSQPEFYGLSFGKYF